MTIKRGFAVKLGMTIKRGFPVKPGMTMKRGAASQAGNDKSKRTVGRGVLLFDTL